MGSGLGPCNYLHSFNIACLEDLPGVVQDHPLFGIAHRVNVLTASASGNNATLAAQSAQEYIENATGALSVFGPGYYGWEKLLSPLRSKLIRETRPALSSFSSDWP
jgi:choline dehydrogenase